MKCFNIDIKFKTLQKNNCFENNILLNEIWAKRWNNNIFFDILTNYIYDKMKYNDNILINIKEKNKEELLKLIVVL